MCLPGNLYTEYVADPEDLMYYATMISLAATCGKRDKNRASAEQHFDSKKTALEFLEIVEKVL